MLKSRLKLAADGLGYAMALHQRQFERAQRWLHNERVRKAILRGRPSR